MGLSAIPLLSILLIVSLIALSKGYHRKPCTRSVRYQFQLPDCYVPPMDTSLLFSQASFVMSHDSCTGYLKTVNVLSTYAKNQMGTVYHQLNNGARALDLRPLLLANGTISFAHGSVHIPVSLDTVVEDAVRWCNQNYNELVLMLPSNLIYESSDDSGTDAYVTAMQAVFDAHGVVYLSCADVYGLTIAEIMELSQLQQGGYLLALDSQDSSGSFCGKSNWVNEKTVTCYSYPENGSRVSTDVQCTKRKDEPLASLREYALESANNEATDDRYTLGPPADQESYPLNEIQALWQVDTQAVTKGLSHLSTLLEDNRRSRLNSQVVDWVYNGDFDQISLLAVDNIALYGNALLSVTRNTCGQSTADVCGKEIDPPRLTYVPLSWYVNGVSLGIFVAVVGIAGRKLWSRHRTEIETALLQSQYVV